MEKLSRQETIERAGRTGILAGCDLSGVDLGVLDLIAVDFRGCVFRGASLAKANLSASRLDETDLAGCRIDTGEIDKGLLIGAKRCTIPVDVAAGSRVELVGVYAITAG